MKLAYRKAKIEDLNEAMRIYADAQSFMEANGNPQWPKGFPDENDVKCGIVGGVLYVVTALNGEIAAVFSAVGYDRDYDDIDGGWLSDGKYLAVNLAGVYRMRNDNAYTRLLDKNSLRKTFVKSKRTALSRPLFYCLFSPEYPWLQ